MFFYVSDVGRVDMSQMPVIWVDFCYVSAICVFRFGVRLLLRVFIDVVMNVPFYDCLQRCCLAGVLSVCRLLDFLSGLSYPPYLGCRLSEQRPQAEDQK